ncbi:MAG: nucleoid-associated protein, partial [Defluviitaleaceae bacterium]|nr:nucleoid-associated protein [Defluviitaleaceae bacterium]
MEIFINHAIMHIVDNTRREYVYSAAELDIDSDMVAGFLDKHIKKILKNSATKEGLFNPDSQVFKLFSEFINGSAHFTNTTQKICEKLVEIMDDAPDIPAAVVIFAQFEVGSNPYFGILKLNHMDCYSHETANSTNQIVKTSQALPFNSGKVEEAVLIPYDPLILQIIEKPYPINGQPTNYFSSLFLECIPKLSKKEVTKIIKDVTTEIADKYADDELLEARVNTALIEEAIEKEGEIRLESVASAAFEDVAAREDFISMIRDYELVEDVELGEKYVVAQFGSYKFRASNGIEIKFPVGLMDDSAIVQIAKNADKSVDITL